MKLQFKKSQLTIILLSFILFDCESKFSNYSSEKVVPSKFREFAQVIQQLISDNDIPGLSIAVANKDSMLWSEAFGVLDGQNHDNVNTKTIFSLQSISKAVTATAAMFAVQEGLVSLDTPITSYLPDFKVGSRFEENPERKITLRHLLSHRAGFTHEAPIGNNFQTEFDSFEQHIQSISDTWLKAPVGQGPIYSNIGIDLAGYILQVRSGMSFADFVQSRLFRPLKMEHSSFDWKIIRNNKNRAVGHDNNFSRIPLEYALIPSGACYTNVLDMAKFMEFHLSRGRYKNKILLEEKYLDEMYKIPFSDGKYGLALGIDVYERAGGRCYRHGGGGFGFLTSMQWCPDLNIGVVVLTNSTNHNGAEWKIAENIITKLRQKEISAAGEKISEPVARHKQVMGLSKEEYAMYSGIYVTSNGDESIEVLEKNSQFGAQRDDIFIPFNFYSDKGDFFVAGYGPQYDGYYQIVISTHNRKPIYILRRDRGIVLFFNERFNSALGSDKPEWKKVVGKYSRKMYGKVIATNEISIRNGYLYFDKFRLHEHKPGLFYASNGEVLDLRSKIPTFRNIKLFKL